MEEEQIQIRGEGGGGVDGGEVRVSKVRRFSVVSLHPFHEVSTPRRVSCLRRPHPLSLALDSPSPTGLPVWCSLPSHAFPCLLSYNILPPLYTLIQTEKQ